jgi:hypothetical protein
MDDHLLACQQILERESHIVTGIAKERTRDGRPFKPILERESHIVTRLAKERASFLKINDINDIPFLERLTIIIVVL